jgi:hypothetical protein
MWWMVMQSSVTILGVALRIILAHVHGERLFKTNGKLLGTAFLFCGIVGVREALFYVESKI